MKVRLLLGPPNMEGRNMIYRCMNCLTISPYGFALRCSHCGVSGSIRQVGEIEAPKKVLRCPKCSTKGYNIETNYCSACNKKKEKRNVASK